MHTYSLKTLAKALQSRQISSVELTKHFFQRIHNQHELNAFISIDEEAALLQALAADKQIEQNNASSLTGIPLAHKDLFCTTTLPTTCGSKMLAHYISPYDATIVQRLNQAGVVVVGKTNMDEFAMGSSNETSYFGPVKNPWNLAHVPGGSSGGSAAAVAAGLVPLSTGSDTGGSVRQPAAFCGISGLKPTYGLVSRFGMIAYASSLDQAGILAKTAEDLAYALPSIIGFDERDSTSIDKPRVDYMATLADPLNALKIGLPRGFFHSEVHPAIQAAIQAAAVVFEQLGAQIVDIDLSLQSLWVPCYYVIATAEASSNLARFDGIRFGHRCENFKNLHELVTRSRSEGFGVEVKRRILVGTHVLSSGYFDDYYVQAQRIRRLIKNELISAMSHVDFILGPSTPTLAFPLGVPTQSPVERYLADVFTVAANLAGLPALSIPCGHHQGLPIGMQLMGNYLSEARLLQAAHAFQQQTSWHQMNPDNLKGSI